MKVSIIVPIYKVEDYLVPCLESILAQTYEDYEVILIDDGSPDGCGKICDQYAEKYSGIHVIHKENGGLSSARNAGLDMAKGQYIYFFDSDDTIAPNLLETLVREMDQGLDMLVFNYNVMEEGKPLAPDKTLTLGDFDLSSQEKRLTFLRDTLVPGNIGWEAWSRVFVREKIEKYGLRFADNRQIFAEDLYFSLCYLAHGDKLRCIPDCLYNYRVRQDSIMGVQHVKSNLGRISKLGQAVLSYYRRFDDCSLLTERFREIYYYLMAGQFTYQMWASGAEPAEFRELVKEEMTDWDFMEQLLREYLSKPMRKHSHYEKELRANVQFLLGGSEAMLKLRIKLLNLLRKDG